MEEYNRAMINDPLESAEFDQLMQNYRCLSNVDPSATREALEAVKRFIRTNYWSDQEIDPDSYKIEEH